IRHEPWNPGWFVQRLRLADAIRIDLDEQHLVPCPVQLTADERADLAAAGDDHSHQCAPAVALPRNRSSNAPILSPFTAAYTRSPPWMIRPGRESCDTPSRDTAITFASPTISSSATS